MSLFALPVALLATYVAAQTQTSCNPRNATCPQDPALGTTFEMTFDSSMTEFDPNFFNVTAGTDLVSFSDDGAELTISKQGDSVTVQTEFYIMFGTVEMMFQAAAGQGIISTFNLLSDDLDEIDWEIMGGNTSFVENNYYGWGNGSQYNAKYYPVDSSPTSGQHNYTVVWSQNQIEWILDGNTVRTAPYLPAGRYPQSPCYLKIGIWAGGDPSLPKGTIQWAGGKTNYDDGPFVMTVQSLKIIDSHQNAAFYAYEDRSGKYDSIKVIPGKSNAFKAMHEKSFTQTAEKQWSGLSTGAKIGIGCGVGGAFLIALVVFTFYCISQRRKGKAEKAVADKAWDEHHADMEEYRNRMKRGDFAISHMGHGQRF